MCRVFISAEDSHTGKDRWEDKGVDQCIAPLVNALNGMGMLTRSCCCGHGQYPGTIILHSGGEIIIKAPECGIFHPY